MDALFTPDLFSRPMNGPRPVGRAEDAWVRAAAEAFDLGALRPPVRALGGQGINSQNFLVQSIHGRFVIKRSAVPVESLEATLRLGRWLTAEGILIPPILAASSEALALRVMDQTASVMELVPGDHFSGVGDELEHVAEALAHLFSALSRAPRAMWPKETITADPEATELIADAHRAREAWVHHFGESAAAALAIQLPDLERLVEVRVGATPSPAHIDLHPHNILVSASTGIPTALLDLDSIRLASPDIMLAFSGLKLIRQAVCAEAMPNMVSALREAFCTGLVRAGFRAPGGAFGPLARAEVLRRILIIFRLTFRSDNRAWNHVLPVHLRALRESEVIFESKI